MIYAVLKAAVAVYRANPLRPHCSAAAGRHVALCSLLNGLYVGGEGYKGWNGRGGRNPFEC